MTVKEKLLELNTAYPDTLVYYGTKSAFIAIGNPKELLNTLEESALAFKSAKMRRISSIRSEIKFALYSKPEVDLSKFSQMTPTEIVELAKISGVDKYLVQSYVRAIHSLDNFSPFEDREVTDCYRKVVYPGIVVLSNGGENGKFWTYEEYLNSKR